MLSLPVYRSFSWRLRAIMTIVIHTVRVAFQWRLSDRGFLSNKSLEHVHGERLIRVEKCPTVDSKCVRKWFSFWNELKLLDYNPLKPFYKATCPPAPPIFQRCFGGTTQKQSSCATPGFRVKTHKSRKSDNSSSEQSTWRIRPDASVLLCRKVSVKRSMKTLVSKLAEIDEGGMQIVPSL